MMIFQGKYKDYSLNLNSASQYVGYTCSYRMGGKGGRMPIITIYLLSLSMSPQVYSKKYTNIFKTPFFKKIFFKTNVFRSNGVRKT